MPTRRYLTRAQKLARWTELGCCCTICGLPCEPFGPSVIWDHRVQLWISDDNDPANLEPNHADSCAPSKTKTDAAVRGKIKRLIARENGSRRQRRKIPSRPFGKSSRKINSRPFSTPRKAT